MHKLFALLSGALAILIAVSLWSEMRPQWLAFQQSFQSLLRAKNISGTVNRGIQQDWIPTLHRTDRCRTCHLGISDTAFKDAPQPLRTHSQIPHQDFGKFGCTVCHEGQGLATKTAEAHGRSGSWAYPLLHKSVQEGSCGRCHVGGSVDGAPLLNAGRRLIEKYGCIGCHKLPFFTRPGYIGPDLGRIAEKVRAPWLVSWLQDPREYLPNTVMPEYKLSAAQAGDIASFLMNQPHDAHNGDASPSPSSEAAAAEGKIIFSQSRCITCHALDGKGGTIGPDLGRAGDKMLPNWLGLWLENPRGYFPKTRMPHFVFTPREVESLKQYILTEQSNGDYTQVAGVSFGTADAVESGRKLIMKLGCAGCHVIPGVSDTTRELAPSLESVGSKETSQLVFGTVRMEKDVANWIFVKLQQPRIYGQELVMPDYGFNPDTALAITSALLGQTQRDIPPAYLRSKPVPVMRRFYGPFAAVVEKYRCFVCHSIDGAGGTLAPDLSIEGSVTRRTWFTQYLMAPDVIRPFLAERMPKLNIGPAEIQIMADYFYSAARHDSVPPPSEWKMSGDASHGKTLYFTKYNCGSCHTIGKEGGYYGPPLDNVGNRLEPSWINARLLKAHRLENDTREPQLVENEKDAQDLTAFLMTLRKKDVTQ